jgi:hypothetical protein
MHPSPKKSKTPKGKRWQNYSTKLRTASKKQAQIRQSLQQDIDYPKTARGFFNLGVRVCDLVCDRFGIPHHEMWDFAAPHFGRTPDTLRLLATTLKKKLPTTKTFSLYTFKRTETLQKQIIDEVLSSYWGDDGNPVKKSNLS